MKSWQDFLESKQDQQQHDALVALLAAWLDDSGYKVWAGHGIPGFPETRELKYVKRRPDVFALSLAGKAPVIGEAETARGMADAHTSDQLRDMRIEADKTGAQLYLIVPESAAGHAKEKLGEWGVKVDEVLPVPDRLLPPAKMDG